MNQKHRVALIGCGGRGRIHAAGVRADDRLHMTALV